MIYLLLVNTSLILCFLLYRIFFRRLTFFQWNRIYLLSMLVVALLIPIGLYIDLSGHEALSQQLPTIDLSYYMTDISVTAYDNAASLHLMDVLVPIYWTGFTLSVLWLCYRLYCLFGRGKGVGRHESFSFLGKMFLGKDISHNKTIQAHESVHIQQGHTYDILFLEVVRCFNWFNPVFYFYRKELKFQHECIADEYCADNKVAYAEMLVAHALRTDIPFVHEFSNQSFLKKRIMMLFKNKSNTKSKLFYLSVIPALSVLIASTLVFNTSKARDMVQTIEDRIQDVSLPLREQPSEEPVQTPSFQGEHAREHTSLEIPRPMESRAETSVNRTDTIRDTTRQARLVLRGTLDTTDADGNKLFQSVAVQPEFPGGMTAFRKWVAKNYRYPQSAIDAGVKGVVEATYVVEKDGSLTDIKILKDLSHGTGEALIDLLKKSPKWNPGAQNGRVVRVQYKLPVGLSTENMDGRNVGLVNTDGENDTRIFQSVAIQPEFKGGMEEFRKWIAANFDYPQAAIDAGVKGAIETTFVVEKDGSLSDIKVLKDLGHDTDQAAIDLLKKSPKWSPGVQNGRAVRVQYKLPIALNLQ